MNRSGILRLCFVLLSALLLTDGCGIYSFSGTSIQADVKTICIEPVVNKAVKVNPALANMLTESLNDKFRKLTKLEQVSDAGDLNLTVTVESYEVRATAVTANEVAAQNRLTISIKLEFTNRKYPEDDFEKSFSGYADYDSMQSLDAVEAGLCEEIIEKLVDDIFNATVANW